MKLKPYPRYKDSGVQWMGEISEGLEIKRSGYYIRGNAAKCRKRDIV